MNPVERQLFIQRYWIAYLQGMVLMERAFPPGGQREHA
jgi:hypothetical protein